MAKGSGMQLLVGARLAPTDGAELLCFPTDRAAYGRLCRLLTLGKRRAVKGDCRFTFEEVIAHGEGQVFVVLPDGDIEAPLRALARAFPAAVFLGARALYRGDEPRRLAALAFLAPRVGVRLASCTQVRRAE